MTKQSKLRIVPITLAEANTLVSNWHRHHKPLPMAKICVGVCTEDGRLCGAGIVTRPVSRMLDDGFTLEVGRCVTDGTPNACSAIYSAVDRSAKAQGYGRVFTYTRSDEPGVSLRAAGWLLDEPALPARSWKMPNRKREDSTELFGRQRWLWESGLARVERIFPDMPTDRGGLLDIMDNATKETAS